MLEELDPVLEEQIKAMGIEVIEDGDELDTYGSNYQEYYETFLGSTEVISVDCHDSGLCLRGNLGNDGTPEATAPAPWPDATRASGA